MSQTVNKLPDLLHIDAALKSEIDQQIWEAAEILGEYAENNPWIIWPLTIKYASSLNSEVRQAIATCVLEHILEYHFDQFFDEIERAIKGGDLLLRDTLSGCWKFGKSKLPHNRDRWDILLSKKRLGEP